MFHHGYVFQTMLAEAGPLNDDKVRQHQTMQLLYGVNRPFSIRLNNEWHKVRFCLLDVDVPHYINGDGDWQYCFYIYPDSHTGHLLKSTVLKDSPVSVFSREDRSAGANIVPSVVRPISPFELKQLFEQVIYLFTGKKTRMRPNQPLIQELRKYMLEKDIYSSTPLAKLCGMGMEELSDQFKRITEFSLESWLLHQRLMVLFERLDKQKVLSDDIVDSLTRQSGIAGLDGLDRLFQDLFGIPYRKWTNSTVGSIILTDRQEEFPCFI